jgi:hypothetical protein
LDNEGADSEMETKEDVNMSSTIPRKSMPARNQEMKAIGQLQKQQQSNSSSSIASFSAGFDVSRLISSPTVVLNPVPYHNGLRLALDTQSLEQLSVMAPRLQSSLDRLSSCSSVSTSVDYFGRASQSSAPYQSPDVVSSGSCSNPSAMQSQQHAAQFHPNMHYHPDFRRIQSLQEWQEENPLFPALPPFMGRGVGSLGAVSFVFPL